MGEEEGEGEGEDDLRNVWTRAIRSRIPKNSTMQPFYLLLYREAASMSKHVRIILIREILSFLFLEGLCACFDVVRDLIYMQQHSVQR